MKKYLVIGNPIEHSLSPMIHNYWMKKYNLIDSIYEKRKVEEKNLKDIINEIREENLVGVNVTVPFKKLIIPFLDELDSTAQETKSVNTLVKIKNKIIGYNTDKPGFALTINDLYPVKDVEAFNPIKKKTIFILGAGGVTASIISAFKQDLVKIFLSNRTKEKANELKNIFPNIEVLDWGQRPQNFDVVVNTTSIGLKQNQRIDLDFSDCDKDKNKLFYDLIYNPKETNFLKEARLRGNQIKNGQKMFLNQAMYAFKLWTNIEPEIDIEIVKLLDK
jgi:shikimate dehydrogenase